MEKFKFYYTEKYEMFTDFSQKSECFYIQFIDKRLKSKDTFEFTSFVYF